LKRLPQLEWIARGARAAGAVMRSPKAAFLVMVAGSVIFLTVSAGVAADEDDAITSRVKRALIAADIPNADQIQVRTFNGEADLSGVVFSKHSKEMAATVAGVVRGVTAVKNDLEVRERVVDDDAVITARVKNALLAARIESAGQIEVKTFNGEVDLGGFVNSDYSRTKALSIAGAVRGVTAVRDDLQVQQR
jgi:hyperosmotically inducible protein